MEESRKRVMKRMVTAVGSTANLTACMGYSNKNHFFFCYLPLTREGSTFAVPVILPSIDLHSTTP
jgi:hypothetical protein